MEPDSSDTNVYAEDEELEEDCTLQNPYQSSPSKRELVFAARPHHLNIINNGTTAIPSVFETTIASVQEDGSYDSSTMLPRDLGRRTVRDNAMPLCGSSAGQSPSLYGMSYPGHTSVLRQPQRLAYAVANLNQCGAIGVKGTQALLAINKYVTEHVLEKQEFRNALEWMMRGITPLGNALRAGTAPFKGLFDAAGIFFAQWPTGLPTLSTVASYGPNVADTFMGLLGRTTDQGLANANYDNLQVCDAGLNAYKALVVGGREFVSKATWGLYTRLERVGVLSDLCDSFGYRAQQGVVQSYQVTYDALGKLFGDLATFANQRGINYDFTDAWDITDGLSAQVEATKKVFLSYLTPEISYWNSATALLQNPPVVVTGVQNALADLQNKAGQYIALPISDMTK